MWKIDTVGNTFSAAFLECGGGKVTRTSKSSGFTLKTLSVLQAIQAESRSLFGELPTKEER